MFGAIVVAECLLIQYAAWRGWPTEGGRSRKNGTENRHRHSEDYLRLPPSLRRMRLEVGLLFCALTSRETPGRLRRGPHPATTATNYCVGGANSARFNMNSVQTSILGNNCCPIGIP